MSSHELSCSNCQTSVFSRDKNISESDLPLGTTLFWDSKGVAVALCRKCMSEYHTQQAYFVDPKKFLVDKGFLSINSKQESLSTKVFKDAVVKSFAPYISDVNEGTGNFEQKKKNSSSLRVIAWYFFGFS